MKKRYLKKLSRFAIKISLALLFLAGGNQALSLTLHSKYLLGATQHQKAVLLADAKPRLKELQKYALSLVNRDRQANGLAPLTEDALLNTNAQQHARDMIQREFFDHTNPDGEGPSDRYRKLGGNGGIAENILYSGNPNDATINIEILDRIQDKWMNSPTHRQNILTARYTKFGFGIAINTSSGETYAVQNFQ